MCKVEVGKYVQTIREDSGIWGVEFKLNIRAKSEVHLGVLVLKHHGKLSMLEDLQGNVIDCKFLLANELIECDTLISFPCSDVLVVTKQKTILKKDEIKRGELEIVEVEKEKDVELFHQLVGPKCLLN
jgi:hypothetical protein